MEFMSQEHLDKLLKRREYLANLLGQARKKINRPNWVVIHNWGVPAAIKAQENILEELVRIDIEIDYIATFLKE